MNQFVHLHCHSDFSLLVGSTRIFSLVKKSNQFNMPAIALTDLGNMFGMMEFIQTCKKTDQTKPIVGCEVYLAPHGMGELTNGKWGDNPHRLVLLTENYEGYKNLLKIVSLSYLKGYYRQKPRVDLEVIDKYKRGLIALSAGTTGEIARNIVYEGVTEAIQCTQKYLDVFSKKNFYLEIQNHYLPIEQKIVKGKKEISKRLGVELVATNDVHYVELDDAYTNEILHGIGDKATIHMEKGDKKWQRKCLPATNYYLRSATEMIELFKDTPEAIKNTLVIAERCDLKLPKVVPHMPLIEIPGKLDENTYLRQLCIEGLKHRRCPDTEEYSQRLDYELRVIKEMGFPSYFLIVADLVQNAKKKNILVGPGRGSAAGSLVSYSLSITNLDPIKYGLLFERFLNPERINMPDIDIDFQDNRREEIINYCRKKYGKDKVSQIIAYGKLKAKAVFKDVARFYGVDFETANKISGLIGNARRLQDAYDNNLDFKEAIQANSVFREVYTHSLKLEGLTRQTSIHASGVIIADKATYEYCPLATDEDKSIFTQFEGTMLEDHCGLIKMDFLGLSTLTILDNAIKFIKKYHNKTIDLDSIPLTDLRTYDLLSLGKAIGVFQFESAGMRKYLKELKPTNIDDLTAMNAMYRPGPLSWIPVYIAKKHHRLPEFVSERDKVNFKELEDLCNRNEILNSILSPTNLIPIYQEQIMEIGQKFAGFTLGKADMMRRAMGKKKFAILAKLKEEFLDGADRLFNLRQEADFLYEKIIMPFANYGFNKSHSAGYAFLAYQTAYLKANYPICFMAALLNAVLENTDRIKEYIEEAVSLGIKVIAPDVNKSGLLFTIQENAILYPLTAIKGVASSAGGEIVKEREDNGSYFSFIDFLRRNSLGKINKQNIEQLIKSGSFDAFDLDVEQLLYLYPKVAERIEEEMNFKLGGQILFFEETSNAETNYEDILEETAKMSSNTNDLKEYEKSALGFNIKHDLILKNAAELKEICTLDVAKKENWADGIQATLAGEVSSNRTIRTQKGDEMCFLTMSNNQGEIDVVVFPKQYDKIKQKDALLLEEGSFIVVQGKTQNNNRGINLLANEIEEFNTALIEKNRQTKKYYRFHIEFLSDQLSSTELKKIEELLHKNYGGECQVHFHFNTGEGTVHIKAGDELRIKPNQALKNTLKEMAFVKEIRME